jgi:hypothetical protein
MNMDELKRDAEHLREILIGLRREITRSRVWFLRIQDGKTHCENA